jgi:16S rRNA (guanine966-N2)-methyltransferase
MTDRMKESLFSALGEISGAVVLDLFAGSGALGLEALSRGAKKATFVESARDAVVKLKENIETTEFDNESEVLWAEVKPILDNHATERKDLIFVDPPYNMPAEKVLGNLEQLVMGGYLSDDGRVVVQRNGKENPLKPFGLQMVWEREFGQSKLFIYTHEDEEEESSG